jgi:hypothetical protein
MARSQLRAFTVVAGGGQLVKDVGKGGVGNPGQATQNSLPSGSSITT